MSHIEVYSEGEDGLHSILAGLNPGSHTITIGSRKYEIYLLEGNRIRYVAEQYNEELGFVDPRFFETFAILGDGCHVCRFSDRHGIQLMTSNGREIAHVPMHDATTEIVGIVVSPNEKRIAFFVNDALYKECSECEYSPYGQCSECEEATEREFPDCEQYRVYVYDFDALLDCECEIFSARMTRFLGGVGPFSPSSFSMCFTVDNILLVMVNWRVRLYLPCGSIILVPDEAMPWLRRIEAMSEVELRDLESSSPDMSLNFAGQVAFCAFDRDYFFTTVTEREFVCDEL